MKKIDMTTYKKRNQYNWFIKYQNPCYGFNVDIDVTELVRLSKERHQSFFPYMLYAEMMAINSIDEMRMRVVGGEPVIYEQINPTFTVMGDDGVYLNCGFEMKKDFKSFYIECKRIIEEAKHLGNGDELDRYPICSRSDVVFATSVPVIDYVSMSHPLPVSNQESLSITRSCFDKYHLKEDGRYHVTLNINVSHVFVDGFPLSACFNEVRRLCLDTKTFDFE